LAQNAIPQRHSLCGIIKGRAFIKRSGRGFANTGNEVEASALVRAHSSPRTHRTTVAFIYQPNLEGNNIGSLNGAMNEFGKQQIERTLLGHLEQEMTGEIRIEPAIGS
jgi:hypothetical protein